MRGGPAPTSFHPTKGEHMLGTRQRDQANKAHSPDLFLVAGSLLSSLFALNVIVLFRHGNVLRRELCPPVPAALASSALQPPRLGRDGLLHRRGGRAEPLHAQV